MRQHEIGHASSFGTRVLHNISHLHDGNRVWRMVLLLLHTVSYNIACVLSEPETQLEGILKACHGTSAPPYCFSAGFEVSFWEWCKWKSSMTLRCSIWKSLALLSFQPILLFHRGRAGAGRRGAGRGPALVWWFPFGLCKPARKQGPRGPKLGNAMTPCISPKPTAETVTIPKRAAPDGVRQT